MLRGIFVRAILCRDKLVGVINIQHREPHQHSQREIHLISTIGFLVGPEIELVRVEVESSRSFELAEARRLVERAQRIVAQRLQISEEDAYPILQRESRQRRKSMREIAESILIAEEITRS